MNRILRAFLAAVALLLAMGCGSAGSHSDSAQAGSVPSAGLIFPVETLKRSGDPANRINLVVLGDGYRLQDQDKLTVDASKWMATFLNTSPYANYAAFFNIKLVHVVSHQDGANNGMHGFGVSRDTALGAGFQNANPPGQSPDYRLLVVDDTKALAVAMANAPEFTMALVLVNDTNYGGSGGVVPVFSVNEDSCYIALHEFGHAFGSLADEYACGDTSALPASIESYPNVTTCQRLDQVKWSSWIEGGTPLPTPDDAMHEKALGLFEGAYYHNRGVYRPRHTCKMRSLDDPFCEVCAEAIVRGVYGRVSPIDFASPPSPVEVEAGAAVRLSIGHPIPSPDTFSVEWAVDGAAIAGGGDNCSLKIDGLARGIHQVSARLVDATPLVRSGSALPAATHTWTVNVSGTPLPLPAPLPDQYKHMLLRMVMDAAGFRVLESRMVGLPPPMAHGPAHSAWRLEAAGEDGQILFKGEIEDPTFVRGEFRNPDDPAQIDGHYVNRKQPVSFIFRMPVNGAARINVYQGRGAKAGIQTFLGTVPIPSMNQP